MAVLILSEDSPAWTIPAGETVRVNGTGGADELILEPGAQMVLDASFNLGNDEITFSGMNAGDFQVSRQGATVILTDSSGTRLEIPAGSTSNTLNFADQSLDLVIDASGGTPVVQLGEQEIGSEPADVDPGSGGGSGTTQNIDVGTQQQTETFDAAPDSFIFTDDATVTNFVQIDNFSNNDILRISNAQAGDYAFANEGTDVQIIFNDVGTVNSVLLTGVVTANDLVYDEGSFEAAIGFDAFQMA